ncbi:hypothetical protein [Mesorhizobium sp. Mes31]|uniref:hypothetical protein n=1 Tax=Mesorhizobium sp. Mes31 TaxID=2926017 RepID=UPI002119B50C|nr:hypothetical protein [Mesorhizobium sp. Mes31]
MERVINENKEEEVLTREDARRIAEDLIGKPDPLKSMKISPSLLAAEHIADYVIATGLVSPFYLGGKKKRLKKASYEGRIGSKAYEFKKGELVLVPFNKNCLTVPANSIVFVECDLDFRLPEYIALRFNLQIRHVHRGLLLGTGPLVDPGYWGKLCIPLHNLTSKDYDIPISEGLIWIEFTKTTSNVSPTKAIGSKPGPDQFWNIEDFIRKASKHYTRIEYIPIQSSIPEAVYEANLRSKEALEKSSRAQKKVALFEKIGWGGLAGLLLGGTALLYSSISAIDTQIQISKNYVEDSKHEIIAAREAISHADKWKMKLDSTAELSDKLSEQIRALTSKIEGLERSNVELSKTVKALQTSH